MAEEHEGRMLPRTIMAEKVHDLDTRMRVLEARARKIDDMSRLGKLAYRVVVWTGAFLLGVSTMWALWMDHWGWWLPK